MPSPSLTLLRTQSDDRLVALAGAGHERAFEAIVERYRRPLLRAARRVLPEARAEDALQQALLAAWTALRRGDDVRDLRAWLYRIVRNTSLNALRASGYDYEELAATLRMADAGEEALERRAVVRQTLASLAALPQRQREALLRTAVSGFSQEEVARDLGISDNAMRQLVHRARVSMRAAATALTPAPVVTAAASGSRGAPLVDRIAELAAGAAPAGAAATLAKAGTAVVLAGGALTGPTLADRVVDRPQRDVAAAAATAATASRSGRSAGGASTRSPAVPGGGGEHRRGSEHARRARPGGDRRRDPAGDDSRSRSSGPGSGDSGSGGRSGSSGQGSSGLDSSGPDSSGPDSSGPGSSGPGSSGPGSSGPGSSGPDSSGSGAAGSASSGFGSGSSGSRSSGSGSAGSGSSGSGFSGSGSSGSGSGSDSDVEDTGTYPASGPITSGSGDSGSSRHDGAR